MQKGLSESLVSRWILVPAPDVLVNTLIKVSPEGSTLDLPDAAPGAPMFVVSMNPPEILSRS